MAPTKRIDKNTATTYKLVHRPQNDPLVHDVDASQMVFQELLPPQAVRKGLRFSDRSSITPFEASHPRIADGNFRLRDNEGEAAEYGVYYDDTEYDYMQHLREIGTGGGDSHYVEASPAAVRSKGKEKNKLKQQEKSNGVSLDEALRQLDLNQGEQKAKTVGKLTDESILPSKNLRFITYQNQQDVPDALKGFQLDMDWRLREALEALDDEAYVDNDDQDLFDELAQDGEEIDDLEFEETGCDLGAEEDDGWESDHTIRADSKTFTDSDDGPSIIRMSPPKVGDLPPSEAAPPDALSDPLAAFHEHKTKNKYSNGVDVSYLAPGMRGRRMHGGAAASTILTGTSFMSGRHKKRKGALTNPSTYSMTSSALSRSEGLTLLDARFDSVLEMQYEDGEHVFSNDDELDNSSVTTGVTGGGLSVASGNSTASRLSTASSRTSDMVRKDYSGVTKMMDSFLEEYGSRSALRSGGKQKGKLRRAWGGQTGMEQLDQIRKDLGRPRMIDA